MVRFTSLRIRQLSRVLPRIVRISSTQLETRLPEAHLSVQLAPATDLRCTIQPPPESHGCAQRGCWLRGLLSS